MFISDELIKKPFELIKKTGLIKKPELVKSPFGDEQVEIKDLKLVIPLIPMDWGYIDLTIKHGWKMY